MATPPSGLPPGVLDPGRPSPWQSQPLDLRAPLGSNDGTYASGTFTSGLPVRIPPNKCLIAFAKSGFSATLTATYQDGKTTIAFPAFPAAGAIQRFSGSVFDIVTPSAGDANIAWFFIPDGPYSPFDFGVGGVASQVLFASGGSIVDDGSGGMLFKGSSGAIVNVDSSANMIGGAGINWRLNANGVWAVLAQTNDAANGVENILGNSPTPAAVTLGATAVYSPVGDSLSHSDATHPSPPTGNLTNQPAGTYVMAEFSPTNQAGLGYYCVGVYLKVTSNPSDTIVVQIVTDDDGDTAVGTYQLDLTRALNGTNVANVAAASTGTFLAWSPPIPLKADTAGAGSSSTKLIHGKLVVAGAGNVSLRSAWVITQVIHG